MEEKTFLITENNFDKARSLIKQKSGEKIIFCGDDETNRKILEKEQIYMLLLRQNIRKDFLKQRNSGFNEVMAKLAKKNEVNIGIDFDEIIDSDKKAKSEVIARIRQNVKICNKNKLKMMFFSEKRKLNSKEMQSLALILGMPTWMAKF